MLEDLGAVALAGAIEFRAAPARALHLAVPAIRRFVRATRAPLDLDAGVFHYRVRKDTSIVADRRRRGARACRQLHQRT